MESVLDTIKSLTKTDWSAEEIDRVYHLPLLNLISEAITIHRQFHNPGEIETASLLSIKTGGCSEDCAYCPQSAKHRTTVTPGKLMNVDEIVVAAKEAKKQGAKRFCMGAAWRELRDNKEFEKIIQLVEAVAGLEMEVCASLGMITYPQAVKLKEAGLTFYNHNIDSSEDYYKKIISTRSYGERLATIKNVKSAGISVCSGGIIGMGETESDRIKMIHTLTSLPEPPESIPVNLFIPIEGTPLAKANIPDIAIWDLIRTIATLRITLPLSKIRLSAGRAALSFEEHALCFLSGANAIFIGKKLLTAPNAAMEKDQDMFKLLGIRIN